MNVLPKKVMAYAKVNLSLHIGALRPDGLHEIHSIFQSVSLADELTFEEEQDNRVDTVVCLGVDGPNIIGDALAKFRGITGWKGPALRVSVDKRIPVAAGLGGGSADAAATLRAVNEIAGDILDIDGLRRLGAAVGADVPSQIVPGLYLATGAGERLEAMRLVDEFALVLLPGNRLLSTADVYREFDRHINREQIDEESGVILSSEGAKDLGEVDLKMLIDETNELEETVIEIAPDVSIALEELKDAGALATRVTGSGPTTIGIFKSFGSAETAAKKLVASGAMAVKPIGVGSIG